MGFFSFLVLLVIAYLLWRVTDQLPDLIFRMSEIQRDVAEIRRSQSGGSTAADEAGASARSASAASSATAASTAPAEASTGTGDAGESS
jgi:hypothetical protein